MTASTSYSSSVQFYEKVYQLHGQLKEQEEEQYNLQAELNRLMPSTQQSNYKNGGIPNGYSSVISPSSTPAAVSYLLSNGSGPTLRNSTNSSANAATTNGVDKIQEDERRKVRNDMILKKVQELESTAAVFAARSEKLRVMKTEYECMVRRYASKKATLSTRLNMLSSSTPNIVALPPEGVKTVGVSVGVNTEISGPVQPIQKRDFQNGLFLNGYGPELQQDQQHFGPSLINRAAASKELAYSQFMATGVAPPVLTAPTATSALGSASRFHEVVSASQTLLDKEASKRPEVEKEDPKFRHNAYFDISTTSESEATSNKKAGGRRFEPAIPVGLTSIDDSTTTETTASNVPAPAPMKLIKSVRKLSVDLVSETSELLVLNDGLGSKKLGEQQDPFMALQQTQAPKEDANESTRDADASESMATSVGDSVMDSIQNRSEEPAEAEDAEVVPVKDARENSSGGLKTPAIFAAADRAGEVETLAFEGEKNAGGRRVDPQTVIGKFDEIEDEFDNENIVEAAETVDLANGNSRLGAKPFSVGPQEKLGLTTAASSKSKKFKIKTNFDSDSEDVSEAPVAKAATSLQPNSAKKVDEYDDDFDDFFNV